MGRVWDIPRTHSYLRFKQWSDVYGPIYQVNVFGVNHIWLASDKIAQDLLVKRGSIYSDRPPINNLKDSKTAGEYIPLLGHNGEWNQENLFCIPNFSPCDRRSNRLTPCRQRHGAANGNSSTNS